MRLTTGGARVCVCVCAFFSCGQQKIRQPVTIETFIIQFPGRYVRILHGKKRSSYVCIGTWAMLDAKCTIIFLSPVLWAHIVLYGINLEGITSSG